MTNDEGKVPCKVLGLDGNAFAIMGRVTDALRKNGQGNKVDEFRTRATSGDYNNLLRVVYEYVYEPDEDDENHCDDCECVGPECIGCPYEEEHSAEVENCGNCTSYNCDGCEYDIERYDDEEDRGCED